MLLKENVLLDTIIDKYMLKNDAALARLLGISPVVLSKIRNGHKRIGPTIILAVHETTDMPVSKIKELIAKVEKKS